MPTPHKHAEVIKAWADGKTIQYLRHATHTEDVRGLPKTVWDDCFKPSWDKNIEYRVKPELKNPGDVAKTAWFKDLYPRDYVSTEERWENCAKALLQAYINGELDVSSLNLTERK